MKKDIKLFVSVSFCTLAVLAILVGCESPPPSEEMTVTGFLSDYSGLEPISDTSYRYVNPKYDLGNYAKFIVDPVEIIRFRCGLSSLPAGDSLRGKYGFCGL